MTFEERSGRMKYTKEVKCVVWDLDNTVWDGVLLESDRVKLKEGIADCLKELDRRGILHSIASKNNYEDAMAKLTEFGIAEYFLYPEIHFNPKSASLENIRKNLSLGSDTFLFIDDQAFERDEVRFAYPEVECLDALKWNEVLVHPRLQPRFITEDSRRRRLMYLEDRQRQVAEATFAGAPEQFLTELNMEFTIEEARESDLKRAEELTIRTHQLNATGVTYDYEQLKKLIKSEHHKLYICELTDRYGSYGKIGLALVAIHEHDWHLKLLLMSCRVISRGVGTVLLSFLMNEAKTARKILRADFKKTDRNRQMYITYKFANFKEIAVPDASGAAGLLLLENDLATYPPYLKLILPAKTSNQTQREAK
jgi:FkbH-like protein